MARTDTTIAAARTTITIMEGEMSWEELYKELVPNIPFEKAKTVQMIIEETGQGENWVRSVLERKVKEEGWNKQRYKNSNYYWPPDNQK